MDILTILPHLHMPRSIWQTCSACGAEVLMEEFTMCPEGCMDLCPDCIETCPCHMRPCAACGEWTHEDDLNDEAVCGVCARDGWSAPITERG